MKENKYDDDVFFQKYSEMSRSKDGLVAAGEWATLKELLPEFQDQMMLDLGCGYGWHCIYAMEHGAKGAVGIDISQKMLEVAKEKTQDERVSYQCVAMEDMDFEKESFDIVLSSLAFHYIKDFDVIVKKVASYLKPNGVFVFSVEHPVFTAEGSQDWVYDEQGAIEHFPVDSYYYEGQRTANFLGEPVIKYHRTLTSYLDCLLTNGFILERIVEPAPTQDAIEHVPGMKDEMRRPMMLIVKAKKHGTN